MADELGLFFLVAKPEDQISQNAKVFIEEMKANKKEITVIEYPNAVHSFIESNNPEGLVGVTTDMSEVVNEEQQNLARQAENEIYNWLLSHWEKTSPNMRVYSKFEWSNLCIGGDTYRTIDSVYFRSKVLFTCWFYHFRSII